MFHTRMSRPRADRPAMPLRSGGKHTLSFSDAASALSCTQACTQTCPRSARYRVQRGPGSGNASRNRRTCPTRAESRQHAVVSEYRSGTSFQRSRGRVSWSTMASPLRRPMGWILLLAAFTHTGWVAAHAFADHDSQQHHHGIPSPPSEAERPDLAADRTAHEHEHLDDAMLVAARTPQRPELVALPSFSPEPVALDGPLCAVARKAARPRAGPELAALSQPRAPPRA